MTRLRAIAPLLVAVILATIAVITVKSAGCAEPGRYVPVAGGYELVGGCIAPGDIVVPEPVPTPQVTAPQPDPAKS